MAPSLGARKAYASGSRIPFRPPRAASTAVRVGKSTRAKADAALKLARTLARQIEVKSVGGVINSYDMIGGAVPVSLCDIGAGDADGQRTGIKVNFRDHALRFKFAHFVQSNVTFRAIVFQDKQTNAAAPPVASDVLNLTAANVTTQGSYNMINADRFKILGDKSINLNANFLNQDTVGLMTMHIKNYVQGGHVGFSGTGAANVDTNKIWLMVIADYAAIGAGNCTITAFGPDEARFTCQWLAHYADA